VSTSGIERLIDVACASLQRMILPDGLFCLERIRGDETPHGRSVRYSLMTYVGLARATRAGHDHGFDLDALKAAVWRERGSSELRPGDYGLFLWADSVRSTPGDGSDIVDRAGAALAAGGGVASLAGQEVAWLLIGLARHDRARASAGGGRLYATVLDELLGRAEARTGLLRHYGRRGGRSRFGNFATQIYGALALSYAAAQDERALMVARGIGDALLGLQLADGGWPWLFDTAKGRVVEEYEVYSVHQHAMAPMGLLELAAASGDSRYAEAARAGLAWIHGGNELGVDMVDPEGGLIYRSIRRKRPFDRGVLYGKTAAAAAVGRSPRLAGFEVELQTTCRPYELGWLLEAWCGRESLSSSEPLQAVRGVESGRAPI
jgi:hypothetical protein